MAARARKLPEELFQDASKQSLARYRIGVDWRLFAMSNEQVFESCKKMVFALRDRGAQLVNVSISHTSPIMKAHQVIISYGSCLFDVHRAALTGLQKRTAL
jgi:Asp-tRNA(Asn)/Glu-tRNA(Gln) amidotransferase A subunit family amidase